MSYYLKIRKKLIGKKNLTSLAGASILIAFISLLSKGIGFMREVVFASRFGLSSKFDLYLIAAVIPFTINTIISTFTINYLIPRYSIIKQQDIIVSKTFIKTNFYLFVMLGFVISIVLFSLSDTMLSFFLKGSQESIKVEAKILFNILLITIPINTAVSVIIAFQQGDFKFGYSVVSQLIPNTIILFVVFFIRDIDILIIPISFILGYLFQLIVLIWKSRALFTSEEKSESFFSLKGHYLSSAVFTIILIESIGQFYIIADRFFFYKLNPGDISSLNFAQAVFILPISIISYALSTAIFPKLSELSSKNNFDTLSSVFIQSIQLIFIFFLPITIIYVFWGKEIVSFLFERGNYSNKDSVITATALIYYSVSLIFYAIYGLLNKIMYSLHLIKHLLLITILGIAVKLIFNALLVVEMGQYGLALSTSISFIFFFITSTAVLYRKEISFFNFLLLKEDFLFFLTALFSLFLTKVFSTIIFMQTNIPLVNLFVFILIFILNLIVLPNKFIYNIKFYFISNCLNRKE
jgi:putative peptidoglycan lipid II flippase